MKIFVLCSLLSLLGTSLGFGIRGGHAGAQEQVLKKNSNLPYFAQHKRSGSFGSLFESHEKKPTILRECMTVASLRTGDEETWVYRSEGMQDTCGLYVVGDPDSVLEMTVEEIHFDCQSGLVMLFDGWELNGNVIPSVADHQVPLNRRQTTICDPRSKTKKLTTHQNAGLVSYRMTQVGQGFRVRVKALPNKDVCNILMSEIEGFFTLSNHGKARNCSLTTLLFPASFAVLSLDVGHPVSTHKRSDLSLVQTQCPERGNHDYIELGGAQELDSDMITSETICGHKSAPVESGLTVLCGSSTARLVSSGQFHNSVTVFVKAAEEQDLLEEANTVLSCPQ